jgi:hypothetical protein
MADVSWHVAAMAGAAQMNLAGALHAKDEGLPTLHFKMPMVKPGAMDKVRSDCF